MLTANQARAIRFKLGIAQKDMADLLEIPKGTWSNVELGNTPLQSFMEVRFINLMDQLDVCKPEDFPDFLAELSKEELEIASTPWSRAKVKQEEVGDVAPVNFEGMEEKYLRFYAIAQRIAETLESKNRDYGDSFHNVYKRFGDVSTFIRLSDKLGRYESLITEPDNINIKDEPIEDVLMDMAGYCILTLASKEELQRGN